MKPMILIPSLLAALALSGCAATVSSRVPVAASEIWPSERFMEAQAANALILERSIYPWHFLPGTAEPTPLAERRLELLGRYFGPQGGSLLVRQGEAEDTLYRQRIALVRQRLAAAGADAARVHIDDAMPGGDGLESMMAWRAYMAPFERTRGGAGQPAAGSAAFTERGIGRP